MTTPPDQPRHTAVDQDPDTPYDKNASGGWGSLEGVSRIFGKSESSTRALDILRLQNKPGGVMCTSCAWAKPAKPHPFEFCENGAKATLWELDTRSADPDFFAAHTLSELRELHDHDLEKSGRLTHPLRYDPASDRYLPVSWDEAIADIGARLKAIDPREAVFYSSGHAGLEASYLYALFARAMGHQNLPQSSNMCHETTSVNLQTFLGTPVGTCVLEDFDHCDAIFFFGQNTGSNSPRFLHTLKDAVERGCKIVTFNPVRERGLVEFVDPQNPVQMTVGKPTEISDHYYQVRPGGDVAVLAGLMKCVLEAEDAAPGTVLDHDFIAAETTGFEETATAVRAAGWDEIERHSGLTRAMIEQAAAVYLSADNVIGIYGMGLTQHVNGWLNLGMLCNLLLMRGNVGRLGAGISPVRGHSNVQGQRTVGIGEKSSHMPADKLREMFGIDPPEEEGLNAVHACEALLEGKVRAMIQLGGNLVRALPDRERMEAAWPDLDLTVYIATKPNRTHLTPGKVAYLLPCLGRTDEDIQASGQQAVSMEDSLSHIYGSIGRARPHSRELKSETAIVAAIAKATLPPNPRLKWDEWVGNYDLIRDLIAETFPDKFADFNDRLFEPGGFYRGNPARERNWQTESGKAQFTPPTTLSALGEEPQGERVMTLVTLRSNDQFNTTIYGFSDRLRGLEGSRDILLINLDEMARLGLSEGQKVALRCAIDDGRERRVEGLTVTGYDLPPGCVAGYYPELNPLIPLSYHEKNSQTPAYKGTPVEIVA
ncbi:Molybdopterin-containing oxidoreductase, probable formate dehydrogenase [Oceanicola granulosus HTCC2516]|uniref:Molybdopterin-containing oxidoreductase, probable formate dehydrogenase n=1 Tax=Oceanicola granulosus (strain ATCC BAA-861 / DSM 15982 / KCTC 12143 / HTCC2516) TaxID=314256 RepID=Q2CC20_OCEGH|nr:FdhF/YdeP family oxidoreductase [Oceanicola granulosus]EAR50261.1 Molybdopterin-containing oxidoreductase, probable formate dehydrogenase [Oceanicola granulosus HTCC2516]